MSIIKIIKNLAYYRSTSDCVNNSFILETLLILSQYEPIMLLTLFSSYLSNQLTSPGTTRREAKSNQNNPIEISNETTLLFIILPDPLGALLQAYFLQESPSSKEHGS